jgi:hypothetical protein
MRHELFKLSSMLLSQELASILADVLADLRKQKMIMQSLCLYTKS